MERKFEFIGFRKRLCDIVIIGMDWFDYRNDEAELPLTGAYCRTCNTESAKPVFPIYMNAKPAYALQCTKCKNEYPMYKHTYIHRYIGYNTSSGGHINPTHGLISHKAAMDRKAIKNHNNIPKKVKNEMCKAFGMTSEEYDNIQKKWDKERQKINKQIQNSRANLQSQLRDEQIQRESDNRKELIEKGILKYIKNVGLVNTETGEVVKL